MKRVAGLAVALLATAASASAQEPAPLEPVELDRLPLPPGVSGMSHPDWTPDGEHLVFGFSSEDSAGLQFGLSADDGSGFRCLSCGLDQVLGADRPLNALRDLSLDKPYVFGDGRRVLGRIIGEKDRTPSPVNPLSGPTQDFNFVVLECAPSLLDCAERALVPIELPGGGLTRGVQNREARISPDSRLLAWTEVMYDGTRMSLGRLVRGESSYTLEDVRVLNPPFELAPPDPEGFRVGGPLYELKNFAPDGRTLTYASFAEAENYDVWELNLATGERRRLTDDLEWNEGTTRSPDNGSFVNFSSRTRDRMTPFAQVPRPPFIDFPLYVLTGRFMLNAENRKCLLSPWLFDSDGERGTYFGQPIDPDPPPGFAPHGNGPWSADGTKIVFWEFNDAAAGTPADPGSHLVVARLPAREPTPTAEAPDTPFPDWAPGRDEWSGYHAEQGVFTVAGPGGGTATITLAGMVNSQVYSVEYDGYSADGQTFLDGTERVDAPFIVAIGRWTSDLTVSGEHTGRLQAEVEVRTGGNASGTLLSEYDGKTFDALPAPTCDRLPTPQLVIEDLAVARSKGGRAKRTATVTGFVRAVVPGDEQHRPVRSATISLGGASATTDEHGRFAVTGPVGAPLVARAAGFVSAETALP